MPLPVIADIVQVVWNWTHPDAGYAKNVMYFRNEGDNSLENLGAAIESNIASGQFDSVAEDAQVDTLSIRPLDGISASIDVPVDIGGGASGDDPVPATCALVSLKTAFAGRSFRGRIYLPFTAEVSQANGLLTVSTSSMTTAWTNWAASMSGDDWPLQVCSLLMEAAQPVTVLLVETALATQRRRQSRLR